MEKATWQILPPRKRGRRSEKISAGSVNNEASFGSIEARTHQIEKNVAARAANSSSGKNAEATLEGRDGCPGEFYEYLDHTADVQCHAWGNSLEHAFENMAPCMFNYMTDLALVKEDLKSSLDSEVIEVKGHDMNSLLFNYMDELLFRFSTDSFCTTRVKVHSIVKGEDKGENVDPSKRKEDFIIQFSAYGALYDRSKHVQGTEVKAITYSNMQIHENKDNGRTDLYVIVDI